MESEEEDEPMVVQPVKKAAPKKAEPAKKLKGDADSSSDEESDNDAP